MIDKYAGFAGGWGDDAITGAILECYLPSIELPDAPTLRSDEVLSRTIGGKTASIPTTRVERILTVFSASRRPESIGNMRADERRILSGRRKINKQLIASLAPVRIADPEIEARRIGRAAEHVRIKCRHIGSVARVSAILLCEFRRCQKRVSETDGARIICIS